MGGGHSPRNDKMPAKTAPFPAGLGSRPSRGQAQRTSEMVGGSTSWLAKRIDATLRFAANVCKERVSIGDRAFDAVAPAANPPSRILSQGSSAELSPSPAGAPECKVAIDELIFFRGTLHVTGWGLCPGRHIVGMGFRLGDGSLQALKGYGLPSPDVAAAFGAEHGACRFVCAFALDSANMLGALTLIFSLENGEQYEMTNLTHRLDDEPYHVLQRQFFGQLATMTSGTVLEIGSRNRSGNVRRNLLPPGVRYVGMDILAGENVDAVGDVHALGEMFPPASFDAIFSISVFEHLLMPWKAVLEMGKVLKPGGQVMIATHHTYPLHETPWDYFRFSDQAWHGLFNEFTGFEVVQTALGETALIVPQIMHKTLLGLEACPAFIGSAVLARKVSDSALRWDVDLKQVVHTMYPQ